VTACDPRSDCGSRVARRGGAPDRPRTAGAPAPLQRGGSGGRPAHAPEQTGPRCRGATGRAGRVRRHLRGGGGVGVVGRGGAERPDELVVYGGTGKAVRDWASFDAVCRTLTALEDDETLLVQSGRPVGVFTTHPEAPRVLIANANLVGRWATWEVFRELERK